jgi:ABC-2 type transport system permease protein
MWAMIVKEFRQLRRDRRTLAMMIFLPVLLLIIFGYAARFDVKSISATVVGPQARTVAAALHSPFNATTVAPGENRADAVRALRDGRTPVAFVTGAAAGGSGASGAGPWGSGGVPREGAAPGGSVSPQASAAVTVLLDGSQLFTATAAKTALAEMSSRAAQTSAQPFSMRVDVLYNPGLKTSDIMVPGLAGLILLFVGMVITSLGVVRERQAGTLEQLAVMPLRPRDVFLGKIAPYFLVAAVDLAIVVSVGVALFSVPFRGSVLVFGLGALLFLFVTLGMGVLISSVSQTQGQAIQLAIMAMLPQIMLSGLIFPLSSMAAGVRWIGYLLPLTYFTEITRGVMLRGAPISSLWEPFVYLALLGTVVTALATLRFRQFLAPAPRRERPGPPARPAGVAALGAEQ